MARIVVALLWALAVLAGVAITAVCYSFPLPVQSGGSPLLPQPIVWATVLVGAALAVGVLWWVWSRSAARDQRT